MNPWEIYLGNKDNPNFADWCWAGEPSKRDFVKCVDRWNRSQNKADFIGKVS